MHIIYIILACWIGFCVLFLLVKCGLDFCLKLAKLVLVAASAALMTMLCVGVYGNRMNLRGIIDNALKLSKELRDTSTEARNASKSSQQATEQTIQVLKNLSQAGASLDVAAGNLSRTAASLTTLIRNTDHQVNAILLPSLANTVSQNDQRLTQLVTDTDATVVAMGKTSTQATAAMALATQDLADAGKILGDPANQETVRQTAIFAKNAAETSEHLDATTADIQVKVHQMTRPASWAKTVGLTILSVGSDVANMLKGF